MRKSTATFLCLLTLTGCIKEPKTEIDYGPEVPQTKLASELQLAIGESDSPALLRKEEFVGRETTRVIRGRPVIDVLSTTEVTIVERNETARQWQIKDVEKVQSYDPGDPTNTPAPIVREDHKCWNKATFEREECEIALKAFRNQPSLVEERLKPMSHFQTKANDPAKTVTYHNLIITKTQEPPPDAVVKDAGCRGINNCLINVTQMEFDRVDWTENTEGYKIHYTLKISQDVPSMSRFLQSCQQGSVQVLQPGQDEKTAPRYLVTFCDTVKNFIPGI